MACLILQPQPKKQSPSPPPPGAKDSKPAATPPAAAAVNVKEASTPVSTKPGATAGKEPTSTAAATATAAAAVAPVVVSTPGTTGGLKKGGGLKAGGSGASGGVTAVAPAASGAVGSGKGKITPEQRLHNSLREVLKVRQRDPDVVRHDHTYEKHVCTLRGGQTTGESFSNSLSHRSVWIARVHDRVCSGDLFAQSFLDGIYVVIVVFADCRPCLSCGDGALSYRTRSSHRSVWSLCCS